MSIDVNIKSYIEIDQRKNYPLFKSITVKNESNFEKFYPYEVEVVLLSENNDKLILLFQGVFNIKINPTSAISNIYIDIMNVSKMQIENAIYYISADEEETFSFHCKSFIVYKS